MRGKESIEENCARIPLEMGFWVRDLFLWNDYLYEDCF